jgi:L-rhamnose mutarotase
MGKKNARYLISGFWLLLACTNQSTEMNPAIIEIVGNASVSSETLSYFCQMQKIEANVYQWQNHLAYFGTLSDVSKIEKQAKALYPGASLKIYKKPFYTFDRRICANKERAQRWSHTIMTANLVADETMQQEYMDYHAHQQQDWPEVANGFCNAGFQQVLVFRNGRQLMLIISIPEREHLHELNPKTTENNPRVDEWNVIMSKYQESIEDAVHNEIWAVFDKK